MNYKGQIFILDTSLLIVNFVCYCAKSYTFTCTWIAREYEIEKLTAILLEKYYL